MPASKWNLLTSAPALGVSRASPIEDKEASERLGRPLDNTDSCPIVSDANDVQTVTLLLPCGDNIRISCPREDSSRPKGILIVEDDCLLRKLLGEGLRKGGFQAWTAAGGAEAIAVYRQFWPRIDIVLSELHMPVIDGSQILEALREINPFIRLCFVTGDTRKATRADLLRSGVLRVFEKPLPSIASLSQQLHDLATTPVHPGFDAELQL